MKQVITVLFLLLGISFNNVYGRVQQTIPMHIIDENEVGGGHTYAPPRPWYITQDDYVLTLPSFEDGFTLELRDESDTVAYSTYLSAGMTQVVLPSTLLGEYELRILPYSATYYYRGYLNL